MDSKKHLKILHIAVVNAGFPSDFCEMHKRCGDYSRLVTLYRNKMGFPEDICLDYFLPKGKLAGLWRKKKQDDLVRKMVPPTKSSADCVLDLLTPPQGGSVSRSESSSKQGGSVAKQEASDVEANAQSKHGGSVSRNESSSKQGGSVAAHYFQPQNLAERIYFHITDAVRKPLVERAVRENGLNAFDIIHYDFGLDFYRNSAQAKKWKRMGKKIVCCYYGSDLRIRGIIREMEAVSDLNITAEYDHLSLKPDLEFMFYPYDTSELPAKRDNESGKLRIVHSPTNRQFKGTDTIIKVIERLKQVKDFDFYLLENRPRSEVLKIKSESDIGIECVGGVMGGYGYGKSGLEMLGLSMPVVTSMTSEYAQWLPENPFVLANNEEELYEQLLYLLDNPEKVKSIGEQGKQWVDKYHGFEAVNERLYELYRKYGIVNSD